MALSNDLKVLTWIANKSLLYLVTNNPMLKAGSSVYEAEFDNKEYAKGSSIQIRRSNRRVGGNGAVIALDGVIEKTNTLTIDNQFNDGLVFTSQEMALFQQGSYGQELYAERYIYPSMNMINAKICSYLGTQAEKQLGIMYGTPATPINSYSTVAAIRAKMEDLNMPVEQEKYLITTPSDGAQLKSSMVNYFNSSFNKGIGEKYFLQEVGGFMFDTTSGIARHTSGTAAALGDSTIQIKTSITSGASVDLKGLVASTTTIVPGDRFTVAGAYRIAPTTFKTTTHLVECVVTGTSTITADSSGYATVPFAVVGSEGIITDTTNPFLNCIATGFPANAYVSFKASHNVNVAMIKGGLDYAAPKMQEMWTPYCVNVKDTKFGTGINLRVSRGSDIVNDQNIIRVDVLFGAVWHKELAMAVLT